MCSLSLYCCRIDPVVFSMGADKSDFHDLFFIPDMDNQAECVVHDLKPCTVVLDHFSLGKISQDILFGFPIGLFNY